MSVAGCTPAPPPPPFGPSDWSRAVHGNCFSNIERLGLWVGGQTAVPSGADPSPYFRPVAPGALGAGPNPPTIYVLTHGWAPGYRATVDAQGGNLLWWGAEASVNGAWASDWAWSPVSAPLNPPFPINPTGVLQAISAIDPSAVVVAYSWIDDSATDSGLLNLTEVYRSEACTHANGLRLASALLDAIAPSFWDQPTGLLRTIGHSHGSKVATVAALTLQNVGKRVAHLTICDAPESFGTREVNGANLLGFYLEQMQIANPSYDCAAGTFVDSYASYFGVSYAGSPNLESIVEVSLDSSNLYRAVDPADHHTYAASWYGGAARGAEIERQPPLGVAWPPPPDDYLPGLNQTWPTGTNQSSQWTLQSGNPMHGIVAYTTESVRIVQSHMQGNVRGDPSTSLVFGPTPGPSYAVFVGYYQNSELGSGVGLAFDLLWTAPQVGDYLVVAMKSSYFGSLETLLVVDGQSYRGMAGKTSIAINSIVSGPTSLPLCIYFIAAADNTIGVASLSNFRRVDVRSVAGSLAPTTPPDLRSELR
ncbi:MAG TPA: hypothetical protein VHF27_06555 [Acidimicrobiales bacterium]|nr:hypothetical protein [Acidimicrobiales bacterium]